MHETVICRSEVNGMIGPTRNQSLLGMDDYREGALSHRVDSESTIVKIWFFVWVPM